MSRTQIKDRSRAPGVWDKMWEQIPMVGEQLIAKKTMERRPAVAANRPQAAVSTGISRGKPPVASNKVKTEAARVGRPRQPRRPKQ